MGLKRLLLLVAFAAAMSLGLASSAPAGNYDEQAMGCTGQDPGVCPTGTEGQAYSLPLELIGNEDEGCDVHKVSSGSFPPGLSVNSDAARIEGTPTQAGSYRFYLTVTLLTCPYPCGSKCSSDDEFVININPGLAKLTIGPELATTGTTGAQYSLQMTASVPDAKTWTINSGALPPGLALDANTGLISGTPTAAGQFDFQVLAKVNADARSDTKSLAIVVREPVSIVADDPFTSARRAPGEVSAPFEAMLTATGGNGAYTWSLSSGALPSGLLFADGAISGTPSAAGVYSFTVTATDSEGRVANYPARIVVVPKLTISTRLVLPARVGKFFQRKLATVGGVKPAVWRIARGPLPRGVFLDRYAGVLYGYPSRPGTSRVLFEAKDSYGVIARKTLRVTVLPAPKTAVSG
ncbi:MAG: Ig domain-containing protein [Gaiellaceae bacterium]